MLLNTKISFALKNTSGQYEIKEFSLFEMDGAMKKLSNIDIHVNRSKEFSFQLNCPLCGEKHNYSYSISELFKREMLIGGCESLGMPLFFIGNNKKVNQRIKRFNEINNNISAMI